MKIIGLTGGIASGKSTVADILRRLGAEIFDADAVSREAVAKGSQGLRQVIAAFGAEYLTAGGELDRAKLSRLVFEDKAALKKLESIVHAYVRQEAKVFWSSQPKRVGGSSFRCASADRRRLVSRSGSALGW